MFRLEFGVLIIWFCPLLSDIQTEEGGWLYKPYSKSQIAIEAGTMIKYVHKTNKFSDSLFIEGPTTKPLRVMVS